MREFQPRAQQSLPPQVALDSIDPGERFGPESGVFLDDSIFNDEPRPRQQTNGHLAKGDLAVQGALYPRLQTAAVPFCTEIRGNEPHCGSAQQEDQEGMPNASVGPKTHQRAIIKVRRQRVFVGK